MMADRLSVTSKRRLRKAHPDLARVTVRASEILACERPDVDFKVGETVRSLDRQVELVARGASMTMNGRHLLRAGDKYCHAVDLIGLIKIDGRFKVTWDWPIYHIIADAMKRAAQELRVPLDWGGDWKRFPDGPHFQLPWGHYP